MSVTGINNKPKSTDKKKGYVNDNGRNSNFTTYVSILTEEGKNKEDLIQRVTEANVLFNNKHQLLCSNNLSFEIKKKLVKRCIWSVAVYGSETETLEKNEKGVVNVFETWSWRGMLKIKWIDRIMNGGVFQSEKEERLLLKILKK